MLQKLPESVGEALQNQRAGLEHTVIERLRKSSELTPIEVSSSAFAVENTVPVKYTADGGGISPPLEWRRLPDGSSFVAIIVEDADSPTPHPLVHAIVVNLDPRESSLVEGALTVPNIAVSVWKRGRIPFWRTRGCRRIPLRDMALTATFSKCSHCAVRYLKRRLAAKSWFALSLNSESALAAYCHL